jgi:hypothetical protein
VADGPITNCRASRLAVCAPVVMLVLKAERM